jgi:hypothetical protein
MKTLLVCASALAAIGLASTAVAQPGGVKIGTLSCHERASVGYVVGATIPVRCLYSGVSGSSRYDGHISKIGVDIGYQGSGRLVWAVFAPTDRLGPGALNGHYGGVSASAAVGLGVGANALLGGSNRTIALQPISVEGTTGLDVSAGLAGLTLHAVPGSYEPA